MMELGSTAAACLQTQKKTGLPKMVGISQSRAELRQSKIEFWMRSIIRDGGIDRFDDLHVNRIDDNWAEQRTWISAACEAFNLARTVRDSQEFPFSLAVGLSLKAGADRKGVNFHSRADIEREMSPTPPSLYLFRPGQEPWAPQSGTGSGLHEATFERIDPAILGLPVDAGQCFYFEFKGYADPEYSRSILFGNTWERASPPL
jgi:hypothetical protein